MQSTREFSSVSQAPTRCTDGAEGITKFRNSDSAAHMKYRTYSTSWCAGEEILLLKETYHLDKDLLMHHIMSATPLKRRRYNEPCSSSEGNILLCLVSLQGRSHSSEAFGAKRYVSLEPLWFSSEQNLLTAQPADLAVQHPFHENCSYYLGLNILIDNYRAPLQSLLLFQSTTTDLCLKLWSKYITGKWENETSPL